MKSKTTWEECEIRTDKGEIVKGQAPVIISASRSTDIPAFFPKWFFNRLKKGYVKWINPFDRKSHYISFEKTRIIIFWTKNPKPIIPFLSILDDQGINYYFQYTINDYDNENFEPNVPNISERLETIKLLAEKIGKEKIIWRFDPLILSDKLTVRDLLKKVWDLGNKLLPYTNKLVYSYADISEYKNIKYNLIKDNPQTFTKDNVLNSEFSKDQKIEFAVGMQKILFEWKKSNPLFKVATCAEDIELKDYGIEPNKCIDDKLMTSLFKSDKKLMSFIGYDEMTLFPKDLKLKDKGQRKECGCIISKDIGSRNTCNHLCTYCYANISRKNVTSNQFIINEDSETILDKSNGD